MKSVAIFNNKGGVGKTTFLCNLAAFLALRHNKSVLLVDADPQCNATQSVFDDDQLEKLYTHPSFTIIDVIRPLATGKGFSKTIRTVRSKSFGLDVLPGDPDMSLMEDLLATDWVAGTSGDIRGLRTTFLFKDFLQRLNKYDFVFFDMGPSLGSINRSVLIAADYFITPMSIDIFSLRAITNIGKSLKTWRKKLERGLEELDDPPAELEITDPYWNLQFIGYVSQQYIRKTIRGKQQAVKAYDRIMKQIPSVVARELVPDGAAPNTDWHLGSIPNLHSLVPLSQTNHTPIFELKGRHGVVGAHFAKVREYDEIMKDIADRFLKLT